MSTPPDTYAQPLAGPGLDVWAGLGVRLESLTAAIREQTGRLERLWADLHEVPVTGPALSAAGQVADQPATLGPQTGYWWDVRRLAFAAPGAWTGSTDWAGTIWLFCNLPAATTLITTFTPEQPARHFSKATVMLEPHDRLVYAAGADFTGTAQISGRALTVTDKCVPAYRT